MCLKVSGAAPLLFVSKSVCVSSQYLNSIRWTSQLEGDKVNTWAVDMCLHAVARQEWHQVLMTSWICGIDPTFQSSRGCSLPKWLYSHIAQGFVHMWPETRCCRLLSPTKVRKTVLPFRSSKIWINSAKAPKRSALREKGENVRLVLACMQGWCEKVATWPEMAYWMTESTKTQNASQHEGGVEWRRQVAIRNMAKSVPQSVPSRWHGVEIQQLPLHIHIGCNRLQRACLHT